MLLFDFHCPQCNAVFEELVNSDAREAPCPSCHFAAAERQIGTPTIDPAPWVVGKHPSEPAIDKWARNRRRKIAQEKKDSGYVQTT